MSIELILFASVLSLTVVIFVFQQGKRGIIKGLGGGFILGCIAAVGYSEINTPEDKIIDKSSNLEEQNKAFAFKYTLLNAKEVFKTEFITMEVTEYKEFKDKWGFNAKVYFENEEGKQCKSFVASYTNHFGVGELKEIVQTDTIKDCE